MAMTACEREGLSLPPHRTVHPRWFSLGRFKGSRLLDFRNASKRMSTENDWIVVRIDRAGKVIGVPCSAAVKAASRHRSYTTRPDDAPIQTPTANHRKSDPDLRQRMAKMHRRGAIVGGVTLAICVGAILAGNRLTGRDRRRHLLRPLRRWADRAGRRN